MTYYKNVWRGGWKSYAIHYRDSGYDPLNPPVKYEVAERNGSFRGWLSVRCYDKETDTFYVLHSTDGKVDTFGDLWDAGLDLTKEEIKIYERYTKAYKLMER